MAGCFFFLPLIVVVVVVDCRLVLDLRAFGFSILRFQTRTFIYWSTPFHFFVAPGTTSKNPETLLLSLLVLPASSTSPSTQHNQPQHRTHTSSSPSLINIIS
jgi:hypothetical protein